MRFDVITIFPKLFDPFLAESLMAKALAKKIIDVNIIDLRSFTQDRHRTVDDRPYGGGPGMVLKPEPMVAAIESVSTKGPKPWRIFLSPSGRSLDQKLVTELLAREHLVLVCARYEGLDQRAIDLAIDEEISLGDYVLNGGEIPAMAVMEAVARLVPGFMGKEESAEEESHQSGLLEYPHFTRPAEFRGLKVPDVLLSGNHAEVIKWRQSASLARTLARRPELILTADLDAGATKALAKARRE